MSYKSCDNRCEGVCRRNSIQDMASCLVCFFFINFRDNLTMTSDLMKSVDFNNVGLLN